MELKNLSDEELFDFSNSDFEVELKNRGYTHGWFKPTEYAGDIYILVNPAFPNLVKIGYANNTEKRMKTLNGNSGLPDPYHCYATYKVKKRLEDLQLHNLIDMLNPGLRHTSNREFYEMDKKDALKILSAIAQINGDEDLLKINPFNDDFFDESDIELTDISCSNNRKRPKGRLTFEMLGIPAGSTLTFKEDESITVETVDNKSTVLLEGVEYKMSGAVKKIKRKLGTSTSTESYQGGAFFKYNGEILTAMQKRLGL